MALQNSRRTGSTSGPRVWDTYIQTLAYDINTVINATNILAVAFGWLLLPHFGRRPLFLVGLVSLGGTLVVLGILAFVKQSPANLYAQGAMLVVQSFWFQANINPLSYAIAGEIPATRLRPQTRILRGHNCPSQPASTVHVEPEAGGLGLGYEERMVLAGMQYPCNSLGLLPSARVRQS
jgi:hypothetical protein